MMKALSAAIVFLAITEAAFGLRFVIDNEECMSQKVDNDWDTVHASFVVVKYDSSWQTEDGVDLVVKGPHGTQIRDFQDKVAEKFEFQAEHKGVYKFCFTNKSPYHETIDFDVHVGHVTEHNDHAKDHHLNTMFEHIAALEEGLDAIHFEQHWLLAQTDRQAMLNEGMSKRTIYKAVFEASMLVSVSAVQVYLLRRLFEKKLGAGRI